MRHGGFTLLELTITIAIIGIISAISFGSGLFRPKPLDTFISQLSSLTATARINAIRTNTLHRIHFDFDRNVITIQQSAGKGSDKFKPLPAAEFTTSMIIDPALKVTKLFIERKDELSGSRKPTAWFFIAANGTAQAIQLTVENSETKQRKIIDLNPFIATFAEHDETEKNK